MPQTSAAPQPPSGPPRPGSGGAPVGAIVLIVVGALLALAGLGVGAGGGLLTWAHATQRDSQGFYTTPTERLETTTYAITSDAVDLGRAGDDTPFDLGDLATFRLFGPTCDSSDELPGDVELPRDVRPGDHIEFGCIGAYSLAGRTSFNGFHSDRIVTITDSVPPGYA